MTDLERQWLPEIIWSAALASDDRYLLAAFSQHEKGRPWTSIDNYTEWYVTLWEPNPEIVWQQVENVQTSSEIRSALKTFMQAVEEFDRDDRQTLHPSEPGWERVRDAAKRLIHEAGAAGRAEIADIERRIANYADKESAKI